MRERVTDHNVMNISKELYISSLLFTLQAGTRPWSEKSKGIQWSSRLQRQADCWCRQVCCEGSKGKTNGNQWAVSVHKKHVLFFVVRSARRSILLEKLKKLNIKRMWIARIELVSRWSGPVARLPSLFVLWSWAGNLIHRAPLSSPPPWIIYGYRKL